MLFVTVLLIVMISMNNQILTILSSNIENGKFGSCLNKCCSGYNTNCKQFDLKTKHYCFCDQYCERTKDCCDDYNITCKKEPKVDCILSNWSEWSKCSRKCGRGNKKRTRKILVNPRNGGISCGSVIENKVCEGVICPVYKVRRIGNRYSKKGYQKKSNTARLVPDFGSHNYLYKTYSKEYDIRQHMFHNDVDKSKYSNGQPYCVMYQITIALGSCSRFYRLPTNSERSSWSEHSNMLKPNQNVCVTCYSEHQNDQHYCQGAHPSNLYSSQKWLALRSDVCYGYAKMINWKSQCVCPKINSFLFI